MEKLRSVEKETGGEEFHEKSEAEVGCWKEAFKEALSRVTRKPPGLHAMETCQRSRSERSFLGSQLQRCPANAESLTQILAKCTGLAVPGLKRLSGAADASTSINVWAFADLQCRATRLIKPWTNF